jgi:outer membrane protein assembly factor BamD (BamD/ComL family)
MIRDDLVKQLEKAEQIAAATRGQHISISFPAIEAVFRANEALHIWDMAYAAGAKDEREACANVCDIESSVNVTNASEQYQEGRSMGAASCGAGIRARGKK